MSCNGCRVLRKGCMDNCIIRLCLEWIKNSESQANATFFLAKFYGRAGLLNLINSGPVSLRPDIFRSLLYEACGRVVDPVHGAVGLLCSGNWQLCETAVQAVLDGAPMDHVPSELAAFVSPAPPLRDYDICYTAKAARGRARIKRSPRAMGTIHEDRQCLFSVETGEASHMSQAEPGTSNKNAIEEGEAEADLTLSLMPPPRFHHAKRNRKE